MLGILEPGAIFVQLNEVMIRKFLLFLNDILSMKFFCNLKQMVLDLATLPAIKYCIYLILSNNAYRAALLNQCSFSKYLF